MSWIDALAEKARGGVVQAGGGVSRDVIARAESEIGAFPQDYRRFLAEFGCMTIGAREIFGLSNEIAHYMDVVKMTLIERQDSTGFSARGIVIMNDGGGNLHYLDGSTQGRVGSPVRVFHHDDPGDVETVALNFADWILGTVK